MEKKYKMTPQEINDICIVFHVYMSNIEEIGGRRPGIWKDVLALEKKLSKINKHFDALWCGDYADTDKELIEIKLN